MTLKKPISITVQNRFLFRLLDFSEISYIQYNLNCLNSFNGFSKGLFNNNYLIFTPTYYLLSTSRKRMLSDADMVCNGPEARFQRGRASSRILCSGFTFPSSSTVTVFRARSRDPGKYSDIWGPSVGQYLPKQKSFTHSTP